MPSGKKLYDIILHFNSVVKRIIINFLYYNIIPQFVRTHAQQRHAFCQIYTVICGFPPRRSRCFPTILYKKPLFCRFLCRKLSGVLKRKMQFLQNSFAIPRFADRTHILVTIYDTTQSPFCQCLYGIFTLKIQLFCVNIFHCCVYIFGFNAIIFIASLPAMPARLQSRKQKSPPAKSKAAFLHLPSEQNIINSAPYWDIFKFHSRAPPLAEPKDLQKFPQDQSLNFPRMPIIYNNVEKSAILPPRSSKTRRASAPRHSRIFEALKFISFGIRKARPPGSRRAASRDE